MQRIKLVPHQTHQEAHQGVHPSDGGHGPITLSNPRQTLGLDWFLAISWVLVLAFIAGFWWWVFNG